MLEETLGDVWEGVYVLRVCKKEDAASSSFSICRNEVINGCLPDGGHGDDFKCE